MQVRYRGVYRWRHEKETGFANCRKGAVVSRARLGKDKKQRMARREGIQGESRLFQSILGMQ